jgi:excinuclease ABC subunit B
VPGLSSRARAVAAQAAGRTPAGEPTQEASAARGELVGLITELTEQMHAAAAELHFEVAARLRDEIRELKSELRGMHAAGV